MAIEVMKYLHSRPVSAEGRIGEVARPGLDLRRLALVAVVLFCAGSVRTQGGTGVPSGPVGLLGTRLSYGLEAQAAARSNQVERLTMSVGPVEDGPRGRTQWLALHGAKANGQQFTVWMLGRRYASRDLAAASTTTERYLLQEGDSPVLEFRHRLTDAPVLPTLGAWEYLWPQPEPGEVADPLTAPAMQWLGHRYVRDALETNQPFPTPHDVRCLSLRPDVLVGVPSNQRTQDDTRRYDGSEYPMVRLTRNDYLEMIRAGMNCFRVDAEQAGWLKHEPVFHWGVGGGDVLFPECLFRSTYLGPALFLDEPAVGTRDQVIRPRLAKEPDFRRDLTPQRMLEAFQTHFHEAVHQGAPTVLLKDLRARADVDLGTMVFSQRNLYSWETMIASAAWQLTAEPEGGPAAMVFEPPGRLGSRRTLPELNMAYGCQLPPDDPANLAAIIVGFLRGAARAAGKNWGMSIYGAVDRADAPWLLTHAYDLGATHFFFWDNYQLACVPFGECLALARHLQAHVLNHPDRDRARLRRAAEVAILLPPGYDLGHTHMGRGNLWGLGELNLERTNRHGIRYRQVMGNFLVEIERCRRLGVEFDLLWDLSGLELAGYREIVRVREDGGIEVLADGNLVRLDGPRVPERSEGKPPQLTLEFSDSSDGQSRTVTARARIAEGSSPVYYTTGADRSGVYHNAMVLWELYGPGTEDYRTLTGRVIGRELAERGAAVVETRVRLEQPGRYRLRAATTDLAGRSAVAWNEIENP